MSLSGGSALGAGSQKSIRRLPRCAQARQAKEEYRGNQIKKRASKKRHCA